MFKKIKKYQIFEKFKVLFLFFKKMSSKVMKQYTKNCKDSVLPNVKRSYTTSNGLYELKLKDLQQRMTAQLSEDTKKPFDWTDSGNEHWALFNGMSGLYYGYYNDGDNPECAIDNNRVHGFHKLESFIEFVDDHFDAPNVQKYLQYNGGGEDILEKAMDEAIQIVWEEMTKIDQKTKMDVTTKTKPATIKSK